MRSGLAALLSCALASGAAGADELATGEGHEVVWSPREAAPSRGPRYAPVTVDVYFSFGHSQSLAAAALARRAFEHPANHDLREVLHPIGIGPPGADLAAEAALEADEQGQLWALIDRFIDARAAPGTSVELSRAARELGLDMEKFDDALRTRRHRPDGEKLDRAALAGAHLPGEVLINGVRISPYANEDSMLGEIADARRRAQALLDAGVPLTRLYEKLIAGVPDGAPVEAPRTAPRRVACDLSSAPSRGPSLAPVTLVTFSNLSCSGCAQLAQLVQRARDAHPGQVREVWKAFVPPYLVSGAENYSVELAMAAAAQNRFWELYDVARGHVRPSRPELDALALDAHLDRNRVAVDERAGRLRAAVERDLTDGRRIGLTRAPALLVNGILFSTVPTWERLQKVIDEELARGLVDRLTGP